MKKTLNFLLFQLLNLQKTFFDGLSGTEYIDLNLLFGNVEYGGNIAIAFTLKVTHLHTSAQAFRQIINQLAYHLRTFV